MTGNQLLLYRLAELMLEKQSHLLSVDYLFEDEQIGDFVKSIQIDSPYQQLLIEGVLTESVKDERLYVSFTVEGYFHYVLGEVIGQMNHLGGIELLLNLANESSLNGVNEGIQYFLISEINRGFSETLFLLIDNHLFPIEICVKPLAAYFLIERNKQLQNSYKQEDNSTYLFNSLLNNSSKRDFEILRLVIRYLKKVNFGLVNSLYLQILDIKKNKQNDDFKLLLSEAIESLPVEYINDAHLEFCESADPKIQFELNIDRIRLQRKKNQHDAALKYINENILIIDQNIVDIRNDMKSIFFDALSFYYSDCGEYVKSKEASLKALSFMDESEIGYGVTLNNLALVCIDLNEFELAENYLEQAYKFDSQKFGMYCENTSSRLGNFGYLYLLKGEFEKALTYLKQALSTDQKIFGNYHENIATRLLNISDCLRHLNRNDEALVALLKSREIDIRNYGLGHPMLAASYNIEAHIHLSEKKYTDAHKALNEAIYINLTLNNGINDHINRDFNFQGILYSREGNYVKAMESFLKADKVEELLFAELPQHRVITWINICKTFKNLGSLNVNNQYLQNLLALPHEYIDEYRSEIDKLSEK